MTDDPPADDRRTAAPIDADTSSTDASDVRATGIGTTSQLVSRLSVLREQYDDEVVPRWIDPKSVAQCAGGDEE